MTEAFKPDVPFVTRQLLKTLELLAAAGAVAAKFNGTPTDTEGPTGLKRSFMNAIEVEYATGERFFVMVTEIPRSKEEKPDGTTTAQGRPAKQPDRKARGGG